MTWLTFTNNRSMTVNVRNWLWYCTLVESYVFHFKFRAWKIRFLDR